MPKLEVKKNPLPKKESKNLSLSPNGSSASSPSESSNPKKSKKRDKDNQPKASEKKSPPSPNGKQEQESPPEKAKKREVRWTEPGTKLLIGANALTVEKAKQILGWAEESENVKFRNSFLLIDRLKRKVQCTNNNANRPINFMKLEELVQEILRMRWEFNGEPIILGKTGIVINGQKQLMALVLAAQEVELHPELYDWKKEPVIDKLVVMGVAETDKVIDTVDTAQPRTFADIIFRGPYFTKIHRRFRKDIAKMCSKAVDMLYKRTGVREATDAPKFMSLPEKAAYLNNHLKLLECVKHVYEENGTDNRLTHYAQLGHASALCFLMGCCTTDGCLPDKTGYLDAYANSREQVLDWEMWDKAQEFWVLLAGGDKSLLSVRQAMAQLAEEGVMINTPLKNGLLMVAWNRFANDDKVTPEALIEGIELEENEDGNQTIANTPHCGGIDIA